MLIPSNFDRLANAGTLVLSQGQYCIEDFQNKYGYKSGIVKFLEHDWTLTDEVANIPVVKKKAKLEAETKPSHLIIKNFDPKGEIQSQKALIYDLEKLPEKMVSEGDVIFSKRHAQGRTLADLEKVSANGKVSFYTKGITTTKDYEFGNIGHLDLYVDGIFTILDKIKCPQITVNVDGKLLVGENKDTRRIYGLIKTNPEPSLAKQKFGTIAATHGVLTLVAHDIDASCAHVYGAHGTKLKATEGNIRVGSPDYLSYPTFMHYLSHFYIFKIKNGSYVESGGSLSLEASKDIIIDLGQLHSEGDQWFKAGNLIENVGGKISSGGNVFIQGIRYFHGRKGINALTCLNIPHPANKDPYAKERQQYADFYPTSDRAILESLGNIHINANRMDNVSSSILSGGDVLFNGVKIEKSAGGYYESILSTSDSAVNSQFYEPSEGLFSNYVWAYHDHGYELAHSLKMSINRHGLPLGARNAGCILQSGKKIKINTGCAVISGNWNSRFSSVKATGDLDIYGRNHTRRHVDPTRPFLVNQTKAIANQVTPNGFIQPNARHEFETEFPTGSPYKKKWKQIFLVRPDNEHLYKMSMNLGQVIDRLRNLSSGYIGLSVQSTLSEWAGRVYIEGSEGNLLKALENNKDKFHEKTGKSHVTPEDLVENGHHSMVLWSLEQEENRIYRDMILFIAQGDINPSQGISGKTGIFHAGKDLILHGAALEFEDDVSVTADEKLRLLTLLKRIYTANGHYDVIDGETKVTSKKGKVTAVGETGFQMKGATLRSFLGLIAGSTHGSSDIEDVLLSHLERHTHVEDGGFLGEDKTTYTETETTRSHASTLQSQSDNVMVVSGDKGKTRITGSHLKAFLALIFKGKELETNASVSKHRSITNTEIEKAFSSSSTTSMQESATINPTTLEGSVIIGDTEKATYRGTDFLADIFYDNTKEGAALEPTIAMLEYFQQMVSESAFAKTDVGCKGGYEVMHPCRLMVNKVIRDIHKGEIKLESVDWDKDRTQIIGKFTETTYQLKKWHTEWAIHEQLIPNEALVVVALAITLATQGVGGGLFSSVVTNMTGGAMVATTTGMSMASAALTAVCTQAATSFLSHGDFARTGKDLFSSQGIRAIGTAIATAGLIGDGGSMAELNFAQRLAVNGFRSMVRAGVSSAIEKRNIGDTLKDAGISTLVDSISGALAKSIGEAAAAKGNPLTYGEHKVAHFGVGALAGSILDKDHPLSGAIKGGIGAMMAEVIAESLIDRQQIQNEVIQELGFEKGHPLSHDDKKAYEASYRGKLHPTMNTAKLVVASVMASFGHDPSIAIATSANALENNLAGSIPEFGIDPDVTNAMWDTTVAAKDSVVETAEDVWEHPEEAALSTVPYGDIARKTYIGEEVTTREVVLEGVLTSIPVVGGSLKTVGKKVAGNFLKNLERGAKANKVGKSATVEALDLASTSKKLTREQPWTTRPGQEWKQKIHGRAQKTQTPGHDVRSYREAITAAKQDDVNKVLLNRGYKKATGEQIAPNRRPDVTIVKNDGRVNAIEVPSKSDNWDILFQRNQEVMNQLPEAMQGRVVIKEIIKGYQ